MSFFKLSEKSIARILIIALLVPSLFLSEPRTGRAWGLATFDISNFFQNTATAIHTGIGTTLHAVQTGFQGAQWTKDFALDKVANYIALTLLRQLTASTVNWINSGFRGNPAFVTNPEAFLLKAGDSVAAHYLSTSGPLKNLCSPFRANIQLLLLKNYLAQNEQFTCSIGQIVNNYNNFVNNFDNGGFDTWFKVSQGTDSNPLDAYSIVNDRLNLELTAAGKNKTDEITRGRGYLSWKRCKPGTTFQQKMDSESPDAAEISANLEALSGVKDSPTGDDCFDSDKETVTPGSLIANRLEKVTDSGQTKLEITNSINQVVSALLTQLTLQVLGGNGVRGLSQGNSTQPSLIQQMANGSAQVQQEANQVQNDVNSNINLGNTIINSSSNIVPTNDQIKSSVQSQTGVDSQGNPCIIGLTNDCVASTTSSTTGTTGGSTCVIDPNTGACTTSGRANGVTGPQ